MCKISRFMCKIYRLLCRIYIINCKICTSIKNEKQKLKKTSHCWKNTLPCSTYLEKYMKFNKHHNVLFSLLHYPLLTAHNSLWKEWLTVWVFFYLQTQNLNFSNILKWYFSSLRNFSEVQQNLFDVNISHCKPLLKW